MGRDRNEKRGMDERDNKQKKDCEWETAESEFWCFIPTRTVEVLNVRALGLLPVGMY